MTARRDGPSLAAKMRVFKRDRFTCTYCGAPGTDAELEVDHIIPVSGGGSNHISNLTTSCKACNLKKGNRPAPRQTATAAPASKGIWLHVLKDGEINRQGQIVGEDGDLFLVQWHEWIWGEPTNISALPKAVAYSDECVLYGSNADMRWAYEKECQRKGLPRDYQTGLCDPSLAGV